MVRSWGSFGLSRNTTRGCLVCIGSTTRVRLVHHSSQGEGVFVWGRGRAASEKRKEGVVTATRKGLRFVWVRTPLRGSLLCVGSGCGTAGSGRAVGQPGRVGLWDSRGQTNDEKPKSANESVVSNPKINRDRVIIEDWNSDDEEEEYEVQTVRPETQTVKTRDDKSGQTSQKQGIGFKKVKACFVCKSTDHLIKDCNFHDKKSQEPKLKNVVNTGQREGKPVWDNTKRVNHQNFSKYPHLSKTFVPSGVLTRTGLHRPSVSTASPSISTARPVCTARPSVSTARPVCTARPSVSTARPVYVTRPIYPRMDNVRPRGSCSPIKRSYYTKPAFRPKDLKQDVKTFGVQNMTTAGTRAVVNTGKGKLNTDLKRSRWVWRPKGNYLDHVSKDSGSFML
ncbi:hypothetical protein Tco_1040839 [Tanacetum coccineum]|uniref:Uncharacterized protein n=1 Tax=Tanacetum coccineum TaxID=301880 RepID=A0ABQ5GFB9_9ASTR